MKANNGDCISYFSLIIVDQLLGLSVGCWACTGDFTKLLSRSNWKKAIVSCRKTIGLTVLYKNLAMDCWKYRYYYNEKSSRSGESFSIPNDIYFMIEIVKYREWKTTKLKKIRHWIIRSTCCCCCSGSAFPQSFSFGQHDRVLPLTSGFPALSLGRKSTSLPLAKYSWLSSPQTLC